MQRKGRCGCEEKGAITVFLALIFMSLIIFAGTLIDIVRIAAAERKVQSALNTSARSVLARYDTELIGSYGLYGINVGTDEVKEDFYRYLRTNLEERHKGIKFIKIEVDANDIEIQGMNSLLSDEAFKRQVQEHMKYRMPIMVTDNLIEQLQNIKLSKKVEFAKSEKATRDKARELRNKVNAVNGMLGSVKKKLADVSAEKLEDLSKELSEILTYCSSIYSEKGESLMEDYNKSKEDTNGKAKEGECIENQSEEFADIRENSKSLTPQLRECITEVDRTISIVKPLMKALKELEAELEELQDELSDRDEESGEEEIVELKGEINEVKDEIAELEATIEEETEALKVKLQRFSLGGYSLKGEAVGLDGKEAKELRDFINKKKAEISKALQRRLEKDWLISAEEFGGSNMIVSEEFDLLDERAIYDSSMSEEKAEESNATIISNMERLAKALEDITSSTAEKVSTIEYVMDKYTFLTSRTERSHFFKKGEVEYIISGADVKKAYNPVENTEYYIVTKVLLQVWALRFAIDTIDNFVRSVIVFPPQRLAFALAEGALDSSMDMFNLMNGEAIPLCPESLKAVRLKYSDHLKILLLMTPEEEILRRARQLIQVNIKNLVDSGTGEARESFRLGEYSTVISASVTAKVNLFFLPMLKIDRLMPGSFEGGSYKIRKQIYVGY
ncbi:MAG TPA: hypothetical protein VD757_00210 [Candidatus Nitrosocosmicus sp.]|nr:hypothetical protein [Candidatus Nitrosocosmicus sp.]